MKKLSALMKKLNDKEVTKEISETLGVVEGLNKVVLEAAVAWTEANATVRDVR